ncbi:MAG TPA: cupin domain-containing protein [Acidimicrobiales bacterium]|nr:cupin domain-containing protein [Acidimicrobiales bacterium]
MPDNPADHPAGSRRGRLAPGSSAPDSGEQTYPLAELGPVRVEQILSGRLAGPTDYRQDHDEWVVLLEGGAVLEVAGRRLEMGAGDWVLLPSGAPHTLVSATPGSSWLAVHVGGLGVLGGPGVPDPAPRRPGA